MPTPSNDTAAFQKLLASSRSIIVVAGAGLSAASGIPTFRGAGGMWRTFDAMVLATPEAFYAEPSLVWQFYHYRREKARAAVPNDAHIAIAKFSIPSIRQQIAPDSDFTLITQNVDGLSERTLDQILAAHPGNDGLKVDESRPAILEMHGRLFELLCTESTCNHIELNFDSPVCPALAGTENLIGSGEIGPVIPRIELPRCSKCSSLARPGVVWFGEMPKYLDKIEELVHKADLCLVVGTSSMVYPAAGYASEVKRHGGKVAVFNIERSGGDRDADFLFVGPCEKTLPEALCVVVDQSL